LIFLTVQNTLPFSRFSQVCLKLSCVDLLQSTLYFDDLFSSFTKLLKNFLSLGCSSLLLMVMADN